MSNFYDWSKEEGEEVMPGDLIWRVTGETVQVIRAEIAAGSDFPLHTHPHEQIIVVLQGALSFTVGTEVKIVKAGGVIHAPSGVPHGGRVVGEETVITLEAFHPPREDFGLKSHKVDLTNPK
jgi:quercetin dioxygenase-like cupin family protein